MPSVPADVPCAGLSIDAMLEDIDDSETLGISHKLKEEQVRTFKPSEEDNE